MTRTSSGIASRADHSSRGRARLRAATSAVLQGVVTDSQGGVLPGVTVITTNVETGLVREAPTDAAGFFRATALPPGKYSLQAKLDGFTPYSRTGLVLTIGQTATVNVQLGQVSLTEAITVEGSCAARGYGVEFAGHDRDARATGRDSTRRPQFCVAGEPRARA